MSVDTAIEHGLLALIDGTLPSGRYRTRDLTSIDPAPCPCGRTGVRLRRIERRTDDMLIIRGVTVHPSAVEAVLVVVMVLPILLRRIRPMVALIVPCSLFLVVTLTFGLIQSGAAVVLMIVVIYSGASQIRSFWPSLICLAAVVREASRSMIVCVSEPSVPVRGHVPPSSA